MGHLVLNAGDLVLLRPTEGDQFYGIVQMCAQALEVGTHANKILVVVRFLELADAARNLFLPSEHVRFVDIEHIAYICLRVEHADKRIEPIGPA